MFATPQQYQVPPLDPYMNFAYTSTPLRPKVPQYSFNSAPTKGHSRRASHEPNYFSYGSPRPPAYHSHPSFNDVPPAFHFPTMHKSSKRDHVSGSHQYFKEKKTRASADRDGNKQQQFYTPNSKKHSSSRSQHIHVSVNDWVDDAYSPQGSPPPPYHESYESYWGTDARFYDQGKEIPPSYKPNTTRQRAQSHPSPPPRAKTAPMPTTSSRKATAADAARAGIPAGYSIKNWDPNEEPILLLGSVFDANSLGKWIYDWTVYHHGPATPMSDLAGELWLLLIQLAGKLQRAEEALPRIRHPDDGDLVNDFVESGERLQRRFAKILKTCEDYMWVVAKTDAKKRKEPKPTMGAKSGCEFVQCMFGRDRKLNDTEKLMTGMRLWSMRFDANCDEILRHPGA